MITLPLSTEWNICTPTLFRFLPSEFSEQFFKDGSLRLSSFNLFHKHVDEQRLDKNEGRTMFIAQTKQNGGQTFEAWANQGLNAYVLCTTIRFDEKLMQDFDCDSYIRINNSTEFGVAIARQIPGLIASFEGYCLYQSRKIINQDLGYIDINRFRSQDNSTAFNTSLLSDFINSQMKHLPFFLKDSSYAHQFEYRYIWFVQNKGADFIDIKAPDALNFSEKANSLTE